MWPYPWTHVGTPSHLGHMDPVAAAMPSQAHAGAAQEAPDIGQWEGQDVPLVRPSSCNVKGGIPSSRRYLPTYPPPTTEHTASGLVPGGNPTTTRRMANPQPRTPGHGTPLPGSPGQRSHRERGGDTGPAPTPHQTHRKPHGGSSTPPARGSPQRSSPNGTPQTRPVNTRGATHRLHRQGTHAASHPLPCRA